MTLSQKISRELVIDEPSIRRAIELIDAGNTIPFIARYRKEQTGALSDSQLRDIFERLQYLRQLEARKEEVYRLIESRAAMTDELAQALQAADRLAQIEDIYRPYKNKRRTRATIAADRGLTTLADYIEAHADMAKIKARARDYVAAEKEVIHVGEALAGAADIIAERLADRAALRQYMREYYQRHAVISSKLAKRAEKSDYYQDYHDYMEAVAKIPAHRILALNRAERESVLQVTISLDDERLLAAAKQALLSDYLVNPIMENAYRDGYRRLLAPALIREVRHDLTARAEAQAMAVFAINLKQLLLTPPLKGKVVMGFDPAFRTGCKVAVLDQQGNVLDFRTIYPTKPHCDLEGAQRVMKQLIERYGVAVIALGNGTASRQSEKFIADLIQSMDRTIHYTLVNEAGASVYSASQLASREYPDIDVSIRGAISIGARLQDPLAELVKIEPKSIGVGQYQHDVNQTTLSHVLRGVVEDVVNSVGVDLNTASEALLNYIAGISRQVAKSIVEYRKRRGAFRSRRELLSVKGIGLATFTQAAGFMRVDNPAEVLDSTAVHPESYQVTHQLMDVLDIDGNLLGTAQCRARQKAVQYGLSALAEHLAIHPLLLDDLISELEKPARDPREDFQAAVLRSDVLTIDDLSVGMTLKGTVRNVVDFGAFIDIGIKQDGLVHISEMANRYIKHPTDLVAVGDVVEVKVIKIEPQRQHVALSMKA